MRVSVVCFLLSFIIKVGKSWEKHGRLIEMSTTTGNYEEWFAVNSAAKELTPEVKARREQFYSQRAVDAHIGTEKPIKLKRLKKKSVRAVFSTPKGKISREKNFDRSFETQELSNHSLFEGVISEDRRRQLDRLNSGGFINEQRRLVEDLLDPAYYEKTVHPRKDHNLPTRVNFSISLYQILDVDEHSQSLSVNVWVVQDWFDEFLDWDPRNYGMLNKTIVPYKELWIPDTYLYNSEALEQKKTEALMNGIVTTGHWTNDSRGARVQLMFPAIYRLSCKMDVRLFPYDVQNCTFIFSSWTHDSSTIDYWPKTPTVNLKNMANNEEWSVISFDFNRVEVFYKCCEKPWIMLYAHLVIRRKPLYYVVNLVIPTSIITLVAITGFFTPTSSSSERDEKLYLGINTLLTMSIMMLMVCNQMPSTSTYVPLMSWYYMGIIFVIVIGTLLATIVLAIHGQKHYLRPISSRIRRMVYNKFVTTLILEPPASLLDLWTEFGIIDIQRLSMESMDPLLLKRLDPISEEVEKTPSQTPRTTNFFQNLRKKMQLPPRPNVFFSSISSEVTDAKGFHYERRLASITRQYTQHMRQKERERAKYRGIIGGREVKRQKMMRRCALEWEYLANVLDRMLLTFFCSITCVFFILLVWFENLFQPHGEYSIARE